MSTLAVLLWVLGGGTAPFLLRFVLGRWTSPYRPDRPSVSGGADTEHGEEGQ